MLNAAFKGALDYFGMASVDRTAMLALIHSYGHLVIN